MKDLDFILSFCHEMIPNQGEDSYCYSFCDRAGLLGVFDGCGGAGAKKHDFYTGHTEAYIASRLCAGAFYDSFQNHYSGAQPATRPLHEEFANTTIQRFATFQPPKDPSGGLILGSMVRTLPTTAAAALVEQEKNGSYTLHAIWAGDSRVYLLHGGGLAQLTVDDTSVPDPMDNLYEDGVLRNVFCSDREVNVHCKTLSVKPPFVVLAATDGCFGYLSTPMEFEGVLLHALMNGQSPADWETQLAQHVGRVAGDDHTLCLAAFGYGSFTALQKTMEKRYAHIRQTYLDPVSALAPDDRASRYALWQQYRATYMQYIKDGL